MSQCKAHKTWLQLLLIGNRCEALRLVMVGVSGNLVRLAELEDH